MVTAGIDIGYSNLKVVIGDFSTGPRVMIRPGGACPLENVALAIRQSSSGTSLEAVSRVLELAAAELAHGCTVNPGINRLERALREQRNRALLGGQQIDIRPAIGNAAETAAANALGFWYFGV